MGIYNAAGTRQTKATIATTADPDPLVTLDEDLYETKSYGEGDDVPQGSLKVLLAKAGARLRQSDVDALFHAAVVDAISPNSGGTAGGTVVTITGQHLDGVTAVAFDGNAGTALTITDDDEIAVTTPAGVAGAVDVTLTCDTGNVVVTGGYTYV